MGKELWLEVKRNQVEFNLDHRENCSQCAICLTDFNTRNKEENIPGDDVILLGCNDQHIFHSECLKKWVETQYTCPICREVLANFDKQKLARYQSIVKRNLLISLQNDQDNIEN